MGQMGTALACYRIYALDGTDQIRARFDAECGDDEAALDYAATAYGGYRALEVWEGQRRIGKISGASFSTRDAAD